MSKFGIIVGSMNSLAADDIANAVLYAIDQPKHVAISEVLIRPTGQIV